jgi:predicted nucleic-acid-binding protein
MISLDASILVRYATNDDRKLAGLAVEIIERHTCFVSKAALMEMVFVLESVYKRDRSAVTAALRTIFGLAAVNVEQQSLTAHAVEWYAAGMDFGDAMTLASSAGVDGVATFDRDFQKRAAALNATPPVVHFKAGQQ